MNGKTWCLPAFVVGLGLVALLGGTEACAQQAGAASSEAAAPSTRRDSPAHEEGGPSQILDEDQDTIPDALEQEVAERLFPQVVHASVGEDCLEPVAWKRVNRAARPGVVVYRVFKHPGAEDALALVYAFLYEEDCSAPKGLQHTGDVEGLGYTLVKDPRCGTPGWRIAKARTKVIRAGAVQIDEWSPQQTNPCGPPPKLFITLKQHANVLEEAKCHGVGTVGAGSCGSSGPEVTFVRHNAGEPSLHAAPFRNELHPEFPGEHVWDGKKASAEALPEDRFCGGRPCTGERACASACCPHAASSPCSVRHVLEDRELLAQP